MSEARCSSTAWHDMQHSAEGLPHLLHHHSVVALKGHIHVHVILQGPDLVGCREALAAAALSARLRRSQDVRKRHFLHHNSGAMLPFSSEHPYYQAVHISFISDVKAVAIR